MAKLLQMVLIVALAGSINGFNLFTLFTDTASSVANAVKRPVVLTLRAAGKAAVAEMPGGGVGMSHFLFDILNIQIFISIINVLRFF